MTDNNRRNYYRILHVQPDAPQEVIKSSYRTMMQRLRMHPDLGGDHWNAALINEAFSVLGDPEKRAAYDRELPGFERGLSGTPEPSPAAAPKTRSRTPGSGPHQCPFCHAGHKARPDADAVCLSCGSPLTRPPADATTADWLRAAARTPQDLQIKFWTGWPHSAPRDGQLLDLSLTGLRFATAQALLPDQFLKIDCSRFLAVARVIHRQSRGGDWEIGAEFLTLRFTRNKGAFVSDKA